MREKEIECGKGWTFGVMIGLSISWQEMKTWREFAFKEGKGK